MTPLRTAVLASIFTSTTLSLAASLPRNTSSYNVVVCQPNTRCIHHTIFGHDYKILSTDRLTVMVFLSTEGRYTRADVSITNLTTTPINLSPEDFRIEALNARSKVFLYVPPSQLEEPPNPNPGHPQRRCQRAGESAAEFRAQRVRGSQTKGRAGCNRARCSDPASEGNHHSTQPGRQRPRLL